MTIDLRNGRECVPFDNSGGPYIVQRCVGPVWRLACTLDHLADGAARESAVIAVDDEEADVLVTLDVETVDGNLGADPCVDIYARWLPVAADSAAERSPADILLGRIYFGERGIVNRSIGITVRKPPAPFSVVVENHTGLPLGPRSRLSWRAIVETRRES